MVNRQIRVSDSKYGTFDDVVDPLSPLAPKSPNFTLQILVFCSKHTVLVIIDAHCAKFFYATWVQGVVYQKQLSGPKLMGVWVRGACKNLGPPIYFCNHWS